MRRAAGFGPRVDTALLALCVLVALVLKASSEDVRDGFAAFLRGTILSPLFSMQATTEKWRAALDTYDSMVTERDSALLAALELPTIQAENERLTRMLLLGSRLRTGWIPARVFYDPSLGKHTDVILAAGSDAGIKVLAPVVTSDGLVGVVQSVQRSSSLVRVWTDKEFAVGAMSEDGKAFGIVQPRGDGYMLEFRDVQDRSLPNGTRIVTAGVGGVYPAMIPIGTIVDKLVAGNEWAQSYLVRPAVRPQDISSVIVLDPARAAQGVRGVWPSPAQMDSVVKAMTARGDSIGQVKYRAELKAQTDSALLRIRAAGGIRDTSITSGKAATVPPPDPAPSMSPGTRLRLAFVFTTLIVLNYTLRPMLQWHVAMDFVLIATMIVAVRVRPGAAAVLGFATGLLVDVQNPDALGSSALALACIAFGASFLKASVFSEKPAMNAALFFLGKWGYDLIFVVAEGRITASDSLQQIFIWSPLSAALTAAVGAMALSVMSPLLREARHR